MGFQGLPVTPGRAGPRARSPDENDAGACNAPRSRGPERGPASGAPPGAARAAAPQRAPFGVLAAGGAAGLGAGPGTEGAPAGPAPAALLLRAQGGGEGPRHGILGVSSGARAGACRAPAACLWDGMSTDS